MPSAKQGMPICTPPAIANNSLGGRMKKRRIDANGRFAVVSVGQIDFYDYRASEHPPVLHRKETFLAPTHPEYFVWVVRKDVSHEDTKSRRRQKIKFFPSWLRAFV